MMRYSLQDIAQHLNAKVVGDGSVEISSIAPLEDAGQGEATFIVSPKFKAQLRSTRASVVLLRESELDDCPCAALVVSDPYVAYARLAQLLDTTPKAATTIASSAIISPSAIVGEGVAVGPCAVIGDDAVLESGVQVGAGSVIGNGCRVGADTIIWANVTLYHRVEIGQSCIIHSGAVIGADGFGFANEKGQWLKIPQVGKVVIGNRVEIGANTAIDRGALGDTVIGDGVIIDNLCQIAHNVVIGDNTAIAGATTIAGSTTIGKYCVIGGASVINGHMSICDGVQISGMSMVMRPIDKPGIYSSGIPAQPNKEWRKTAARTLNIDDMYRRLQRLEQQLSEK